MAELRKKDITLAELNAAFVGAAAGKYAGIIDTNEDELVSVDYRGNEHTVTIDLPLNMVMEEGLVKVVAWYDNEWGYARRMIDLIQFIAAKGLA